MAQVVVPPGAVGSAGDVTATAPRWYFLDVLRAFLMLIGIPYHAALYFRGEAPWIDSIALFSQHWRMPTFFVVAGFFALTVARRRGVGPWWDGRVRRLGIPFLCAVTVLSPLSGLALGHGDPAVAWERMTENGMRWMHHSWFLLYLLVYCAVFALAWRMMSGLSSGRPLLLSRAVRGPWAYLGFALFGSAVAGAVGWLWFDLQIAQRSWMIALDRFGVHGVHFLAGIVIASAPGALERLQDWVRWPLVLAAAASSWATHDGWIFTAAAEFDLRREVVVVLSVTLKTFTGLMWAAVLLRVASRFNRPSPVVAWLVAAALPVYLLHQTFVFLFSEIIAPRDISSALSWLLVTVLTMLASFAGYELLNRSRWGRLLTTGHTGRGMSIVDVAAQRVAR